MQPQPLDLALRLEDLVLKNRYRNTYSSRCATRRFAGLCLHHIHSEEVSEMQARLELRRFSVTRILVAFGIAAALLIGLQLGYALKATTVVSGPTRVVLVSPQPAPADDNKCFFIDHIKVC